MAKSIAMPKRSSKKPTDINQLALSIVEVTTNKSKPESTKNPAAVALGQLGGIKGGPARSKSLSKKRRIEIAKKAAKTRWKSK